MSGIYERIGGEAAVMAAVDIFYRRVLADPLTAPFFDETDMAAQARKQVSFMAHAFGGPDAY
jgi:hemoglobin